MTDITAVLGNSQKLDGGAMFGNAPRTLWSKWLNPDELGRISLNCRCLLIRYQNKNFLLEAGIGAFFEPKLAERYGIEESSRHVLCENLELMGVDHTKIDYVILSHLHFDHAGGLLPTYSEGLSKGEHLLFPNATFVVGKEALARAINPHFRDRASFVPMLNRLLINSNRLITIENDSIPHDDFKAFKFLFTNGHTPGQMHTLFDSGKEKIFFCGDLIPGIPWIHVPITMGYDRFAELVIDEKEKILQRAKEESWMLFYTHDQTAATSKIGQDESGRFTAKDILEHPVFLKI